jgi:hypothetical protein
MAPEISLPLARGPLMWLALAVRAGRVIFFTAVLVLLAAVIYTRRARASAAEQAVVFGRDLAQFADVLSGAHRVVINGEVVYVATALSDQDVPTLLDRFQTYCDTRNGDVPRDFAQKAPEEAKRIRQTLGDDWLDHWGVIRDEQGGEGTVMCIAQHDGGGVAGMTEKIRRFIGTGDLHAVGDFRYVYARRAEAGRTQVFTSFTEGPFDVRRVLGRGDAEPPGNDPPDVPRPPDSRRLLSSTVDDSPYALQVFATPRPVDEVLAFYDRELPQRGWARLVGNPVLQAGVWQRQGVTMVVGAGRAERDEETKVTFTEGRAANAAGMSDP